MIPLNAIVDFETTASTMSVSDLLGEDAAEEEKVTKVEGTEEVDAGYEDDEDGQDDSPIVEKPKAQPKNKAKSKDKDWDAEEEDEVEDDGEEEEEEKAVAADIQTITNLAKHLRNEGFKFTVFNVKNTLISYLEMFGERKVARHVLDQDAHMFYEIHAAYIPGAALYRVLSKLGFKPMHPTDLNENYHKDMSYDVAMSNGKVFLNVFGGLQQHAHNEETVIRNLYARELLRYNAPLGISASSAHEIANERVSKNLLLAAMQSHSLGHADLSANFFNEAMASAGIDSLMLSMTEGEEEDDKLVVDEDVDIGDGKVNEPNPETEPESEQEESETASGGTAFEQAPKYIEPTDIIRKADKDNVDDEVRVNALTPDDLEIFQAK